MSADRPIVVEQLWKGFKPDRGRRLLRDQLQRLRSRSGGDLRWVLRDVSFDVGAGESVGLVGVNGSGKSTLLKLLSGVMFPHSGRIEVTGRVGALIEVTTGIHPDLTGRENVLVYGSLLGWRRSAILRRLDEIVAFAELEHALDRQVKHYSSGMKMRLGFSVAAFLDPEVLLVDEVLAVGDSSFQQKCLDRMRAVLDGGTTVVFVSHDLTAVESICSRGIWLDEGTVRSDGPVHEVVSEYRRSIEVRSQETATSGSVRVTRLRVSDPHGGPPIAGAPCRIQLELDAPPRTGAVLFVGITEGDPAPVLVFRHELEIDTLATAELTLESLPLAAGSYFLWFGARVGGREVTPWQPVGEIRVGGDLLDDLAPGIIRRSPVFTRASWTGR